MVVTVTTAAAAVAAAATAAAISSRFKIHESVFQPASPGRKSHTWVRKGLHAKPPERALIEWNRKPRLPGTPFSVGHAFVFAL